jgi:cullin-associated NEDD8-dissociated protein 1
MACCYGWIPDGQLPLLLQALESFVLRSPHEVRPHLDTILSTTLKYLSYDPNYADDMDADGDGDDDEDEADDECVSRHCSACTLLCTPVCPSSRVIASYSYATLHAPRLSGEDYSDDDDTSWKVRRAAAKAIAAIVTSYPDLLNSSYPKVGVYCNVLLHLQNMHKGLES